MTETMTKKDIVTTEVSSLPDELQDAGVWDKHGHGPMTTLSMYYTTSRTNVTIHDGSSSSPTLYYLESDVFTRKPCLYLRQGDSKSSPMVAFVKARWTMRQMMIGLGDYHKHAAGAASEGEDQVWEKLEREKNNFRRSDYHVTILGDGGETKTLSWRKDKSASFKTVYVCVDQDDKVVGRLRSGGMFNFKKGGEIDVSDSLTETERVMLLAAAGGIWGLEAFNYQSLNRGFDKDKKAS